MKIQQKLLTIVLLVLVAATVYGLILTRSETQSSGGSAKVKAVTTGQESLIDQVPLMTAQALVRLPTSAAEVPLAQTALQLGDQEMDLSFAFAVLDATQHPPVLTPEAKELQARLQKAEDDLAAAQAKVVQLTAAEAKTSGARKDTLDDQLDLAKAQSELRQDEVDDVKQDLIRAGGDPQGRLQAMVEEHEAASHSSDSTKVAATPTIAPTGLIQRFEQWSALHQKQLQLLRARQEAVSAASALEAQHDSLAQQGREQNGDPTAGIAQGSAASDASITSRANTISREESAAIAKTTRRRADDQKMMATLDKRIDNEKQLTTVYGQWIDLVAGEQRSILNGGFRGALIILSVALLGLFLDDWIMKLIGKLSMDRRQMETLHTAAGISLQIIGLLLILLVLFGPPTQPATVLGLAGAGLTVALQDFIIAFFGRFVLMGQNGIRLGDWVEINGVAGEVVDLNMFHTVLLETGNWTDSGHPTGRRVTFVNSYAVRGHYFNFSTSGQWLWDELKLVLPAGQNLHAVIDTIHKKVLEATSEGARQAEQEWHGTTRSRDLKALSAEPAINVKSIIGGTEISVRYITNAGQRSKLRAKLNSDLVDLLGSGLALQPSPDPL